MHQGLTDFRATGAELIVPYFLSLLAEGYGALGRVDEGLRALQEGLEAMERTGEQWWQAEGYRLQEKLLLLQSCDHQAEAEAWFQQALDIARQQQVRSLELYAATSLVRLWQSQGKRQDAYDLLAPVYGWFTERFATADLQEARALLAELS